MSVMNLTEISNDDASSLCVVDPKLLRTALAAFATGVCVITTRSAERGDVGLSANSFNSVSLDPPLILWSLARTASAMAAFVATRHFAVHILSSDQAHLSRQFAAKGIDRFEGVALERNEFETPLLKDCAARFECEMKYQYEGGDHVIFVGQVLRFTTAPMPPLVFHSGRYSEVAEMVAAFPLSDPESPMAATDLSYLIWRAFMQFRRRYYDKRVELQLSASDSYLLQLLATRQGQTVGELDMAVRFTGKSCSPADAQDLRARGLVSCDTPVVQSTPLNLTEKGSTMVRELRHASATAERGLLSQLPPADGHRLKH
ncbi:MAG: flavin reductase, partial [Burkholderiaceae bacterium]